MEERVIPLDRIAAVIFDTDGVITDTARVHAAAWQAVFDEFLRARADRLGERFVPFDIRADYLRYVDGKPRRDGVRDFLRSRHIDLPEGETPADGAPGAGPEGDTGAETGETIAGLAARKDARFLARLRRDGVAAFPQAVTLLGELRRRGARTAAVSASRHAAEVLDRSGVAGLFDLRVDGIDTARLGLPGKPHPGLFLEAARRLRVAPERAAVVEDALAGVSAGSRGGFGLVIGLDRTGGGRDLREHGADIVVADLADLAVTGGRLE